MFQNYGQELRWIVPNKRINTRCARLGQKYEGSLRFAWYCSLRIFARYAGVKWLNQHGGK